jgi:iron complex outermembrane receptor protein
MAGLCAGAADGQELLAENAYLGEVPVVLTVSRLAQPQDEAPAAVTVIDRQMIKDSGAWELADVFRLVPGMYVAYHASSAYTTNSAVSYHGLSDAYSRRMQVLVDGRSVYSPLFGGVLWSDIPLALDDIERIEVIRGPNSAMYGANSFLGIINIITRHSTEEQGTFLSVSKGTGRSEGVARHGGRIGDLSYRVTASLRNDDGLDERVVNPIQNNNTWGYNKTDDKKIRLLTFRADYRASPVDEVEFQFGYNGGDRQEGLVSDAFYPRWKSVDNHFELLRWRSQLGVGNELSLQFYHSYEGSKDTLLSNPAESGYAGLTYNADMIAQRYDLEAHPAYLFPLRRHPPGVGRQRAPGQGVLAPLPQSAAGGRLPSVPAVRQPGMAGRAPVDAQCRGNGGEQRFHWHRCHAPGRPQLAFPSRADPAGRPLQRDPHAFPAGEQGGLPFPGAHRLSRPPSGPG